MKLQVPLRSFNIQQNIIVALNAALHSVNHYERALLNKLYSTGQDIRQFSQ